MSNAMCPVCFSDCEGGPVEIDGLLARQRMMCLSCDALWQDVYLFNRQEDITV